ncbi:26S proteasome non-ATPase regulatory subunit 10 [Eumeta japonica]|uniref:26S proteasome non-ATPase regulatory subunit 10 n=1 Tax=Eumeta variegata TaxID=151549 RepID=A0A4C1VVV2_EUMVA|nr:26S proteasome non-ATPase regulatory subunit 10 [Eumeta japonica]
MKFVDTTIFHKPQVSDMRMSLDKYVLSHYDDRMGTAYGGDRMATVHLACEEDREQEAILLTKAGASLQIKNKEQKTPLDLSSKKLKKTLEAIAN